MKLPIGKDLRIFSLWSLSVFSLISNYLQLKKRNPNTAYFNPGRLCKGDESVAIYL